MQLLETFPIPEDPTNETDIPTDVRVTMIETCNVDVDKLYGIERPDLREMLRDNGPNLG